MSYVLELFFGELQAMKDLSSRNELVNDSALHQLYIEFGGPMRRKSYDHLRPRQVACQYVDGITHKRGPINQIVRTHILRHAAAVNPDLILDKGDKKLISGGKKKKTVVIKEPAASGRKRRAEYEVGIEKYPIFNFS